MEVSIGDVVWKRLGGGLPVRLVVLEADEQKHLFVVEEYIQKKSALKRKNVRTFLRPADYRRSIEDFARDNHWTSAETKRRSDPLALKDHLDGIGT